MILRSALALVVMLALVACGGPTAGTAPGGVRVYNISARDASQIPLRVQDNVNSLRQAAGLSPVTLNPALTRSAKNHSRDMVKQNRPWWFGTDASSPLDRAARAGYTGQLLGEVVSETFETEGETLAAWMEDPATRAVILDPRAQDLGFAWEQERAGKIWWTLNVGAPSGFATAGL